MPHTVAQKPKLTYEQEQEALRRSEGRDIHIDPPKEPEVNPEVYRDVLTMLFKGFVMVPAQIGEAKFVFKSLNHHEFEFLQLVCAGEKEVSNKHWNLFLAYNVFMIDGQNILLDRERWLPKIAETFDLMDHKTRQRIVRQMSELNRRANNAVILTECYAMEGYSRYRWAQLNGIDLCSPTTTGIPGTERLGMNWAQLIWRALNYYEDRHEQQERDWDNAKFVGSCSASKGIQKVYQQDTDRRQKEKEDRLARKDKILRQVVLGEKQDDKVKQLPGTVVTGAHTVEELAQQLENDLKGEKDWHDRVVEEHTRRIKTNIQRRQQQVHELSQRHEEEFRGQRIVGGTDFSGLSAAEVQERISRQKQLEAQRLAQGMVRPGLPDDPKSVGFLDRWGFSGNQVEFTVQQTDRDASAAIPIAPPKQGGTPFGRR
jgi:hypothetical protein